MVMNTVYTNSIVLNSGIFTQNIISLHKILHYRKKKYSILHSQQRYWYITTSSTLLLYSNFILILADLSVHIVKLFIHEDPTPETHNIVHHIWRPVHPQFPVLQSDSESQPQRMSLNT